MSTRETSHYKMDFTLLFLIIFMQILAQLCTLEIFIDEPLVINSEEIFRRYSPMIRIGYETVQKTAFTFKYDSSSDDFRPLVVVEAKSSGGGRHEIFVGSRDHVFRLYATDLSLIEKFYWPPAPEDVETCQRKKGQNQAGCRNFIRLLAVRNDEILICGTNAFSPLCTWRKTRNFDAKHSTQINFDGVGFVPLNPASPNIHTLTTDGQQLFTGVTMDIMAHSPVILRMLPPNQVTKTDNTDYRFLNDALFVASFEVGNFVYFFFRETALEVKSYGKFVYSRVGRVCKNDIGIGNKWSTYTKARLNCSLSGRQNAIGFDAIQSVQYSPILEVFVATFATLDGGLNGSALCIYEMASVNKAFSGPYTYAEQDSEPWISHPNRFPNFNCETQGISSSQPNLTKRPITDIKRYQLMYESVQPKFSSPIHISTLEKYKLLEIDVLSKKSKTASLIIFVLTNENLLKKYVLKMDQSSKLCLVEVLQLSQIGSGVDFRGMTFHKDTNSLIITAKDHVFKVPAHRCSRHKTEQQCLAARDPYCGWSPQKQQCTTEQQSYKSSYNQWYQEIDDCPNVDAPVDGSYGQWSSWASCPKSSENGESCSCRLRACDSPAPNKNGKSCFGPGVQIANCTLHGSWAVWSDWSPCSASCGSSVRSRKRSCSSPAPSFGGRVCLGLDVQQEFCPFAACPLPTLPPIDGAWSTWSQWDPCSKLCNGGFQKRERSCENPVPMYNGKPCVGNTMEYRSCNIETCPEVKILSEWTPWLPSNITRSKLVQFKRFRLTCKSAVDDSSLLSVSSFRTEEKICHSNAKTCEEMNITNIDGAWSQWTQWSQCTNPCNNGTQYRTRSCSSPAPIGHGLPCEGHAKELRHCNMKSCESSWSCWNGFGEWSGWSTCNKLGVQVRIRPCLSVTFCSGIPDAQMQQCFYNEENDKTFDHSKPAYQASTFDQPSRKNSWALVGSIIGAFIFGVLLSLGFSFYISKRHHWCLMAKKCRPTSASPSVLFNAGVGANCSPSADHVPSPLLALKSQSPGNIYTPPPTLRHVINGHPKGQSSGVRTAANKYDLVAEPKNSSKYGHRIANDHRRNVNRRDMDCDYDAAVSGDEMIAGDDRLGTGHTTSTLRKNMRASLKTQDYL
uniref:Sema domain-containing protein n=1 Tax=Romanomermis culicivorax TaxID=13658 RepID=A0A915HHL4_ROMCU